jgi:hypothetical protein
MIGRNFSAVIEKLEEFMYGKKIAQIQKIQTTIDGGLRITLDLFAQDVALVSELMRRKANGDHMIEVTFSDPRAASPVRSLHALDGDGLRGADGEEDFSPLNTFDDDQGIPDQD